jgi:hypothetical protein
MNTQHTLIPLIAFVPMSLVGCDEIFTTSDAGDVGADASTSDVSGTGGDGGSMASDTSGGSRDGSSTAPDGSAPDSTTEDDTGAVLSSGQERLLEMLADELAIYCAKSVECGKYDDQEQCEEEYGEYFVTEALEGADLDEASDGCFRAVESYLSCYVEDLECVEEYALSDANCGFARTQIGVACRNVLP